jgi:esterase
MPVRLHSIRFENPGAPIMIILHGLLGASRNWVTIGKTLQNQFDIHALDLRNHGNSPHADNMRWSELVADLKLYLESYSLSDIVLMGHSLGGKVAMKFACSYPKWVKKLIVVDIAAKSYPPYLDVEFRAMKRIPAGSLENRSEAEELLKPLIPDWGMRQFLMMNLVRDEFGLKWQVNLDVLHASLQILRQNSLDAKDIFKDASLLIAGGKSDFIENGDVDAMRKWFPNLEYRMLPKAGHNVHVDDREGFLSTLDKWVT